MPSKTIRVSHGWVRWNVPDGVEVITVTLKGGGSGSSEGGFVTGRMRVNPRRDLHILAGRSGEPAVGLTGGTRTQGAGGAGGNGTTGGAGGAGGGGASYIRWNARDGRIMAVAGGAGGASGNGAPGGPGGGETGGLGGVAGGFPEVTEAATGGTQTQGGKGGTSALGTDFYGAAAADTKLSDGGTGGTATVHSVNGGGGGGGGYFPGGGGAAGRIGIASGGGGAGGSNYTGGLYSSTDLQGNGGTGHGTVVIEWVDPNDPNRPPVPPEQITIDGKAIANELVTKAKHSVTFRGTPDDPNSKQGVRMYVRVSANQHFATYKNYRGTYDAVERRDKVLVDGLRQDTLYYARIYTQDSHRRLSSNYRATSFWTNRRPLAPTLNQPADNAQFTTLVNITFTWSHNDPDSVPGVTDGQTAFQLEYRRAETPALAAGEWTRLLDVTTFSEYTLPAGTFKGNTLYEWRMNTRDEQGRWGAWSTNNTFYVIAETTSPVLVFPIRDEGIVAAHDNDFQWQFRTPQQGTLQERADLRYRVVGAEHYANPTQPEVGLWTTLTGDTVTPGGLWRWPIPADTFEAGFQYEWEVRTYGLGDIEPSDWSETSRFWTTQAPESGPGIIVLDSGQPQPSLGVGNNRVYIYDRGGTILRGEITPAHTIRWGRTRDDISKATVFIDTFDPEMRHLLGNLRTWQHELVIFRDGQRVWEGPVVRIPGSRSGVTIEAWDVMGYVYRRILRQGYNDAYRVMNGQQMGQHTVVERSARIIMNALAYDDPNVLAYLTPMYADDDAQNSRIVHDYTRTAFEEVDDLAATAGLDYTTSGRRIILWDTHRPVGRLPEMRENAFSDQPIVTEYGMSAANYFAVTNNAGVWGAASEVVDNDPGPTGWIEQLASAYGESEALGTQRELTRADRERLSTTLSEQARRNIEGRWPPPVVVRVPDNATLSPSLNLGINQLVPGVWIPLRATGAIREIAQWQKLDSMTVEQTKDGEKIGVVMSPAPQAGEDPDSDAAAEEV